MARADPEEPEGRGLLKRVGIWTGAIGGVLSALLAVTALWDWAAGKLEDPPPPPKPPTIDTRIEAAALQSRNMTLGAFLEDTGQSLDGVPEDELAERGLRFLVAVRLRGEQGQTIPLRWQMIDRKADEMLPADTYDQIALDLTPLNEDHYGTSSVWTPYPPRPGRYAVRFTLRRGERGQPIGELTTADFTIDTVPTVRDVGHGSPPAQALGTGEATAVR